MPTQTFHDRLRAIISARGIKITAIALHLDVARSTVNRWCKYQMPNDEQLLKLAAYLGVSTEYLTAGSDIDPAHMERCHILFSLATGAKTSHVDAVITLLSDLSATKMERPE
nr:helix-turn-helix transcriptional regulator [Chromobacterium sp. ASV5]